MPKRTIIVALPCNGDVKTALKGLAKQINDSALVPLITVGKCLMRRDEDTDVVLTTYGELGDAINKTTGDVCILLTGHGDPGYISSTNGDRIDSETIKNMLNHKPISQKDKARIKGIICRSCHSARRINGQSVVDAVNEWCKENEISAQVVGSGGASIASPYKNEEAIWKSLEPFAKIMNDLIPVRSLNTQEIEKHKRQMVDAIVSGEEESEIEKKIIAYAKSMLNDLRMEVDAAKQLGVAGGVIRLNGVIPVEELPPVNDDLLKEIYRRVLPEKSFDPFTKIISEDVGKVRAAIDTAKQGVESDPIDVTLLQPLVQLIQQFQQQCEVINKTGKQNSGEEVIEISNLVKLYEQLQGHMFIYKCAPSVENLGKIKQCIEDTDLLMKKVPNNSKTKLRQKIGEIVEPRLLLGQLQQDLTETQGLFGGIEIPNDDRPLNNLKERFGVLQDKYNQYVQFIKQNADMPNEQSISENINNTLQELNKLKNDLKKEVLSKIENLQNEIDGLQKKLEEGLLFDKHSTRKLRQEIEPKISQLKIQQKELLKGFPLQVLNDTISASAIKQASKRLAAVDNVVMYSIENPHSQKKHDPRLNVESDEFKQLQIYHQPNSEPRPTTQQSKITE